MYAFNWDEQVRFANRVEAGERLAERLQGYAGQDAVVYALPRGGVVLGEVVARALGLPLDLAIARKVGHPTNPEYAICAVTELGEPVCNEIELARVDPAWFAQAVERERREAARRHERYLGARGHLDPAGKVAILVDDGIATGLTMRAAIQQIKEQHPAKIVVAVPIIPRETADLLRREVDDVVAVDIPAGFFGAVGMYYDDFRQVEDEEVIRTMQAQQMATLRLFVGETYAVRVDALRNLLNAEIAGWSPERYPNGELAITLLTKVTGQPCHLLASMAPPDSDLLTSLLLAHTMKKEGAARVTLVAPYLAYTRQDRDEPGPSRATAWVGEMLVASGVDALITVDIHSDRAADLLQVPVTSLSPAALFAQEIHRHAFAEATPVAPDEGAISRVAAVRDAAGMAGEVAYLRKRRTRDGVSGDLVGHTGPRAVVVDDILDTGGTLVHCCRTLADAGVREILVLVTHGLFTGDGWRHLWDLPVTGLVVTDSMPRPQQVADDRIHVVSIVPLLAEGLAAAR